jgi:hypothetical protein
MARPGRGRTYLLHLGSRLGLARSRLLLLLRLALFCVRCTCQSD